MDKDEYQRAILLVVSQIPAGRVATYGQVAQLAGLPGKARLVGYTMSHLPPGSTIPWHRVINAAGRSSMPVNSHAYQLQQTRLEAEGVVFRGQRVPLGEYRWV